MTGGFRSVVLQRRPDKGGLVSHRGALRRKCTRFRGSGSTCQSVFSSISMAPLSVSRQFKKYYFIFKAKSRLGRYIFKIKVTYLNLFREIPSESRQTLFSKGTPPQKIIYNTKGSKITT